MQNTMDETEIDYNPHYKRETWTRYYYVRVGKGHPSDKKEHHCQPLEHHLEPIGEEMAKILSKEIFRIRGGHYDSEYCRRVAMGKVHFNDTLDNTYIPDSISAKTPFCDVDDIIYEIYEKEEQLLTIIEQEAGCKNWEGLTPSGLRKIIWKGYKTLVHGVSEGTYQREKVEDTMELFLEMYRDLYWLLRRLLDFGYLEKKDLWDSKEARYMANHFQKK